MSRRQTAVIDIMQNASNVNNKLEMATIQKSLQTLYNCR